MARRWLRRVRSAFPEILYCEAEFHKKHPRCYLALLVLYFNDTKRMDIEGR